MRLRGMKMAKKYYHFEDDLTKYPSCWCFAVWSRRGPGKTYSSLKYAYENKIKFIYMKRTDRDVDLITKGTSKEIRGLDMDFSPYSPINRDINSNIKALSIDNGFGAFYNYDVDGEPEGHPIGYILSFNKIRQYKGFDFSECDWIIFDEFIPQKGERLNRAEGELLLDLYMTVARDRQARGRDLLRLVLFANAEEISTPITNELEIVDNMADLNASGKNFLYLEDRKILLHHITNDEIPLDDKEKEGIYEGMYGTSWYKKSFEGDFSKNDFSNVTKRTIKKCSGYIHIHYKEHDYYIYLHKETGIYYMCKRPIRCLFDYNLNRENEQKAFYQYEGIMLRNACIDERMKFETYSMYDLIVNYKKFFTL